MSRCVRTDDVQLSQRPNFSRVARQWHWHFWHFGHGVSGGHTRARAGCFAGRGLKRGGVIFLYPSSGLSAAAQYRLPRPRRRIVPVSLPPAGAGHVRNDPRRRGLESGNESRSPWRKPGELAALSTRFAPICFPTPRCTRRPHPLTSPAAWSLFLDFLDSPRGRARVGSSSLPGPALVLVGEKGRLSRTRR